MSTPLSLRGDSDIGFSSGVHFVSDRTTSLSATCEPSYNVGVACSVADGF